MIDQMYLFLFNLVFTAMPPLVIGVYDKNIPEDLLFSKPYLYRYVSWFSGRKWHFPHESAKNHRIKIKNNFLCLFIFFFVVNTTESIGPCV